MLSDYSIIIHFRFYAKLNFIILKIRIVKNTLFMFFDGMLIIEEEIQQFFKNIRK